MEVTEQLVKRFWKKVHKHCPNGCWEWTAHITKDGYGEMWTGQTISSNQNERAHRISWALHFSEITDGLYVLHKCDNRKCVNPSHLFLGNAKDNYHDAVSKGRPINNLKPAPRLVTSSDEEQIIEMCNQGIRHDVIAEKIGVCRSLISRYARKHGFRRRLDEKEKEQIYALSNSGLNNVAIGKLLNRHQSTIHKFLEKYPCHPK